MQPGDYCKISTGETLCFLLTLHLNSDKQNIFISPQYAIEINVHCTCYKFSKFHFVLVRNGGII